MNHVIVVEDEPLNALLFRKILEKRCGYRVSVTERAAELFEWCGAGGVSLVIMDVSLGNTSWQGHPVNGVDLCKILKSDPRTAPIPVLLATAHAMRGDAESLLATSGADGYIAKPIVDHEKFVHRVRELVERAA